MKNRERLVLVLLLLCAAALVVLLVGEARADVTAYPRWVANAPSVGAVSCRNTFSGGVAHANADSLKTGIRDIEISAVTDTKVTFWSWNGSSWDKRAPKWAPTASTGLGVAASDTVIFIPAGVTKGFSFPGPVIGRIWLTAGTAYMSGE